MATRTNLYKPLIAAVNGTAVGGGFETVLCCDIIIAAEHAEFGLPEPRIGLMSLAGGVQRLPQRIPYHKAMEILMMAQRISAAEAMDLGVVNKVAPTGDALSAAKETAKKILALAPLSIQATKEAIIKSANMPIEEAIVDYGPICKAMLSSEDMMEGAMAFIEKREPNWKGK